MQSVAQSGEVIQNALERRLLLHSMQQKGPTFVGKAQKTGVRRQIVAHISNVSENLALEGARISGQ